MTRKISSVTIYEKQKLKIIFLEYSKRFKSNNLKIHIWINDKKFGKYYPNLIC